MFLPIWRMRRGMTLGAGPTLAPGPPIKLSETPASVRTPPPGFGADTDQVLADLGPLVQAKTKG